MAWSSHDFVNNALRLLTLLTAAKTTTNTTTCTVFTIHITSLES